MPAWNEVQYARAEEFLRTIAAAVPPPVPGATPVMPVPAVPPAPVAPAPAPTAASVFKKIPWKK